jgi:hypothetical protein
MVLVKVKFNDDEPEIISVKHADQELDLDGLMYNDVSIYEILEEHALSEEAQKPYEEFQLELQAEL